jgi:large subunit ribosomal protein L21e
MKRSHGIRCNSRHKLRIRPRDKGKVSVTKTMAAFATGERVTVILEPRIHKGMPHQAFQGMTGLIQGKQGNAYILIIHDGKKEKKLIVRPEHLVRVK